MVALFTLGMFAMLAALIGLVVWVGIDDSSSVAEAEGGDDTSVDADPVGTDADASPGAADGSVTSRDGPGDDAGMPASDGSDAEAGGR